MKSTFNLTSDLNSPVLAADFPGALLRRTADADWTVLDISEGISAITGNRADDFIGNAQLTYASLIHPDDRLAATQQLRYAAQTGKPVSLRYRIIDQQGQTHQLLEHCQPSFDEQGNVLWLNGSLLDMTGALPSNDELPALQQRSEAQQAALSKLARNPAFRHGDEQSTITEALRVVAATLDVPISSIWRFDPSTQGLVRAEQFDLQTGRFELDHSGTAIACEYCLSLLTSQKALMADNMLLNAPCSPLADYARAQSRSSLLMVPLTVGGEVWGALMCEQTGEPRRWFNDESGFAINLAELLSLTLEHLHHTLSLDTMHRKENEARMALGAADAGSWSWHLDTQELVWSSQDYRLLGLDPDHDTIDINGWLNLMHPQDREGAWRKIHEAIGGQTELNISYRVTWPDGTLHWISDVATIIRDDTGRATDVFGLRIDVSDAQRAEAAHIAFAEELGRERDLARRYLDNVELIIVVLNSTGQITRVNRKACEMLGYSEHELLSQDWFNTCVPDSHRQTYRDRINRFISGQGDTVPRFQGHVITRSGEDRLIAWTNTYIDNRDGDIIGLLAAGEDVTLMHQHEMERKQLQSQLQQAQKMESIGQLTGGIAHDFNNILASILGYTSLALDRFGDQLPDKVKTYLGEVNHAGERARDLVSQMLMFSRSTQSDPELTKLQDVIAEATKMVQPTIPSSIQLKMVLDDVPPTMLDPVQIYQLMINLYLNSRDAMGGKGVITVRLQNAELSHTVCDSCHEAFEGEYLELSVTDTGSGINPENIGHLFEPFFSTKEVGKGTGMGLAMVHGIVHNHGGHIIVESQPGKGSCFRILLPMEQPSSRIADSEVAEPVSGKEPSRETPSARIMIVDDEEAIGSFLGELLACHGFQTDVYNSSRAALEQFKGEPQTYQLVVTDQTMPEITGDELAREMRRIRPELPMILCTGYSEQINEDTAIKRGIGYLVKPVDTGKLLDLIGTSLKAS